MLNDLLSHRYFIAVIVLMLMFHFLLLPQATKNDKMIILRLLPFGEKYKLFVSNVPCLEIKVSHVKGKDLKQSEWKRIKKTFNETETYFLLEINPMKNWVFEKKVQYDDLLNPCNREKIGYLKFYNDDQELILPIIEEACFAYEVNNNENSVLAKLVTSRDTILPLWCFGKTISVYYVLMINYKGLFVRPEQLGDINPRPIWIKIGCFLE